jgi:hypothetical protein
MQKGVHLRSVNADIHCGLPTHARGATGTLFSKLPAHGPATARSQCSAINGTECTQTSQDLAMLNQRLKDMLESWDDL